MQIICPKCRYVLRQTGGVHRAGEPLGFFDSRGHVIVCPHCGAHCRLEDDASPDESQASRARGSS